MTIDPLPGAAAAADPRTPPALLCNLAVQYPLTVLGNPSVPRHLIEALVSDGSQPLPERWLRVAAAAENPALPLWLIDDPTFLTTGPLMTARPASGAQEAMFEGTISHSLPRGTSVVLNPERLPGLWTKALESLRGTRFGDAVLATREGKGLKLPMAHTRQVFNSLSSALLTFGMELDKGDPLNDRLTLDTTGWLYFLVADHVIEAWHAGGDAAEVERLPAGILRLARFLFPEGIP